MGTSTKALKTVLTTLIVERLRSDDEIVEVPLNFLDALAPGQQWTVTRDSVQA